MIHNSNKVGAHDTSIPPWGCPHDRSVLASRCAAVRTLAEAVAELPVLPGARQALEAECACRGAVAAQALAGSAFAMERPGDGALRSVAPSPGGDFAQGDAWGKNEWEGLLLRAAAWVRGKMEPAGLLALRDAVPGGLDRKGVGGHRRDAPGAGGAAHGGAQEDRAEPLIAAFADWFKAPAMAGEEPAVRAALAHYHILSLRPLSSGYGPAARLVETALLDAAGYRPGSRLTAEFYLGRFTEYEARAPVHPALRTDGGGRKDDPTPFVAFCLDGVACGVRQAGERVAEALRRVVLERHYEELRQARRVTARQHALLRLLLEGAGQPVGIRSLCRHSPYSLLYGRASEQTARRDLKRLSGMGLWRSPGTGFVLNRRALNA